MSDLAKVTDPRFNDLLQRIASKESRVAADALLSASGEDLRKSFKPTDAMLEECNVIDIESNDG